MSAPEPDEIPDLKLERYRLGELPQSEREQLERRLQQDASLRARLEALEASDKELRAQYEREGIGRSIRARVDSEQRRERAPRKAPFGGLSPLPVALAAAAVLAVAVVPLMTGPTGVVPSPTQVVRLKGLRPELSLHRKTPAGSESLSDGDLASEGDLIRVGYQAAGRSHGVILSLDGRGAVTLHLPQLGDNAAALASGPSLLDQAYELDDAPLWERFYFVTGEAPFRIAPILAAARRLAAAGPTEEPARLELPEGLDQHVVSLSKGETR